MARGNGTPNLSQITQSSNADVEGQGEILRITATPTNGERQVSYDPKTGLANNVSYSKLPTPYVVQRTGGANPKLLALTFDDGPDPKWTPQILAILEQYKVPGTFFVIGENGVANREILQRMVAAGMELGNHSYTHPNMANSTSTSINLELNATRRLIEAYTGRSIRLFRAPYFGDAEPTTADELVPAKIAQDHGYTVVGLHIDTEDWQTPGVQRILDETFRQVAAATPDKTANVILLHDGGGDRAQTIMALPAIITGLRQRGYTFVPISTLAGLTHEQVMPPLAGYDLAAVRADVFAFTALDVILKVLNWTFFFAIALGVIRSVSLVILALLPGRRPRARARGHLPPQGHGHHPLLQRGEGDRKLGAAHPAIDLSLSRRDRRR